MIDMMAVRAQDIVALRDIADERKRQDAKWGEQNHPDGTCGWIFRPLADASRVVCAALAAHGELTWMNILEEEFHEAMAEEDPGKLREELIQVAAVAMVWVQAIDRRGNVSAA